MDKTTIMIIDDEKQMRELIRTFLEKDGYTVIEAANGFDALTILSEQIPDLMLVDVMMPYMDGFSFVTEARKFTTAPIIFLTAKGEEWDKVHGLKLGGDDYIVKPFRPAELLARIESVLRRAQQTRNESTLFKKGPFVIDEHSYTIKVEEKNLSLTRKEFALLCILVKNPERVYTREQLLRLVWGDSYRGSDRTVDTHIKTLRLKMGDYGSLIETVWGVGYKLEV
ncbi:MAG TPA: response regulator transcription factor [Pseudogracilibacillus sp.]|nr:response regulator transcription factor [Pseudogracilibacillus sp.]